MTVRVDYAGPGGACEGLRTLGLEPVGIEWDPAACATRAAAGHLTIRADLATYRPYHRPGSVAGYWASPPCQTFSTAGKGDGRDQLDDLAAVIHAERWADADLFDDKTRHVIDAARTAVELTPEWVAMEQVPAVLPLWRALAHVLERHGYSTWCGVLCAADFAVPQTRRRAILMASRVSAVSPPVPTHAERPGMFGEAPWVSMADALGWSGAVDRRQQCDGVPVRMVPTDEPAPTVTGLAGGQWLVKRERSGDRSEETFDASGPAQALTSKARSWEVVVRSGSTVAGGPLAERSADEPAFTVTSRTDLWQAWPYERPATAVCADPGHRDREGGEPQFRPDAIRLTVRDALILQGFDPGYPVQGSRSKQFEQVGNAVPPPLAAHIVAALTGAGSMRAAS